MRIAGEMIGARGATLLAVTAVVGIVFASHGWSSRNNGVPPAGTAIGGLAPSSAPRASQGPTAGPSSAPSTTPSSAPSTTPSSAPSTTPSSAPSSTPGPKLSSQSYASYAYLVWPGTPSAAAKAAETGLVISVHKQGAGISVSAGVAGQGAPKSQYYPAGVKVYVIEASMGDDSGNSDYNLGDDGLVVTDAQGRILP